MNDLPNVHVVVVCGGRDLLLKKDEDIKNPKVITAVMERTARWSTKLARELSFFSDQAKWAEKDGIAVIHGAAKGADWLAGEVAKAAGYPVFTFPADWNTHGKAAGPLRNQAMANAAHSCIALPGGSGTADMVKRMMAKKALVVEIKE